ncbi:MAG TPA: hypothetical protein VHD62_19215 [Opitutaceae bacterium]|nr:hypothetical protein [Opitutaceae bacterium]
MPSPLSRLLPAGLVVGACALPAARLAAQLEPNSNLDAIEQMDRRQMPRAEPKPIFFPPFPPPLDRAVVRSVTPAAGRLTASDELKAFVGDVFYPQLGTRLAAGELDAKLRARLDAYHAEKLALQNELRTELDRQRDAAPSARRDALIALARRQAPRLATLEKNAEELRRDLRVNEGDWSALREWHLGDNSRRGDSPDEIAGVMRACAYYENGLLPAQRRLLREVALEIGMAGDSAAKAAAAQPYVFFPPEPARVMLPDDVPAALAQRIAEFEAKKSGLKKELYDAAVADDTSGIGLFRSRALKNLAEKQAPALAALESLAEEIRRGLAELPAAAAPAGAHSPLPVELSRRLFRIVQSHDALQREAAAKVDAIVARVEGSPVQISYHFEPNALRFVVAPRGFRRGRPNADMLAKIESIRAEISAIADDYGRRLADLVNDRDAMKPEVAAAIGSQKPDAVDAAIAGAIRAAVLQENEDANRMYRAAVFEPGMSPPQRLLLLDAALEQLDLPLPHGELQPVRRAGGW